jgi:hypothetical protein
MCGQRGDVPTQLALLEGVRLDHWMFSEQDYHHLWVRLSTSLSPLIPESDDLVSERCVSDMLQAVSNVQYKIRTMNRPLPESCRESP